MLKEVIQLVNESYKDCPTGSDVSHFEDILKRVKELKPDADETILIAAYAHDIQRAFRKTSTEETFKTIEFNDPEWLKIHQEEGARIICDFLKKRGYDKKNIERIRNMVSHHEIGGDEESDLIKDADSISYFYTNAIKHTGETAKAIGKEKVIGKIKWMYNRISSEKAKEIARPRYEEILKKLN